MPLRFDESVPQAEYDAFVAHHPLCNLLQSAAWAKVKAGWGHALTGLRDESGILVAAGLVLKRPLPLGLSFWYMPHGPVLDFDKPYLEPYLRQLRAYAKRSRAVAVRIDPLVAVRKAALEALPEGYDPHAREVGRRIEAAGYRHRGFVMGLHESLQPRFIPVSFRPEGLPAGCDVAAYQATLSKKSRTLANNARNRFVEVTSGGAELLDEFLAVIAQTEQEKEIKLRSKPYYESILKNYGEDARIYLATLNIADALAKYSAQLAADEAELAATPENAKKKRNRLRSSIDCATKHIAELESHDDGDRVTLAGVLMVRFGRSAEMLYAGTNRNYGNIPAQHLMWVHALADGFAAGLDNVSLGGVDGSLSDSLMQFKSRFNPQIVEKIGEFQTNIIVPVAHAIDYYLRRR
ncbi:peptidoglycan bridge formation glycyltransferase FemA/FemB family protein [Trueperella pyogenes]|uniref:peptidoglycan bridge formation glycyltransferase FemA/FemB family protein n=1 Tax=Trueperella pyogenes TaxID=1661 RepID=UPI0024C0CF31|nr:peptidoglycan bridge formation glycyltransferase FemA/FemB family protein [Trueperella pyogenes]WHU56244.1 peptidoglycan bridge formation glycyltransferase FemA/FemB family protein [Trueperella pyogenes]